MKMLRAPPGCATVNLRGGYVNVFFQKVQFAQSIMQLDLGHHIGLVPVFWGQPALGDHALGSEVDDVSGPPGLDQLHQAIQVMVQVRLFEAEPLLPGGQPFIGQEDRVRFV